MLAALSGLSIALYTGLETMAVAARPLWHTPWLPWLLTLSAVLGAQSALLLLNRLLAGWGAQTESTLLRQSGWTLGLLALSLLGWALFGGASAAEAAALYRLDPSWRLAAHWLLLTRYFSICASAASGSNFFIRTTVPPSRWIVIDQRSGAA